jgi:hypothetical protein
MILLHHWPESCCYHRSEYVTDTPQLFLEDLNTRLKKANESWVNYTLNVTEWTDPMARNGDRASIITWASSSVFFWRVDLGETESTWYAVNYWACCTILG